MKLCARAARAPMGSFRGPKYALKRNRSVVLIVLVVYKRSTSRSELTLSLCNESVSSLGPSPETDHFVMNFGSPATLASRIRLFELTWFEPAPGGLPI
jgi:hypothetical protein